MSHWRSRARAAIERAIAEHNEQPSPPAEPATDRAALIKRIDAAYPFGPRQYHPYKMWLEERRRAIARIDAPTLTGPIGRKCGTCGQGAGRPCQAIDGSGALGHFHAARTGDEHGPLFGGEP